jgi:hypothetical protein
LAEPWPFGDANRERAQEVKTRLAEIDDVIQRDLIDWGYVIGDTGLCRWVFHSAAPDNVTATMTGESSTTASLNRPTQSTRSRCPRPRFRHGSELREGTAPCT